MVDQAGKQRARPGDAGLLEGERQLRKAHRHAPEHQRAARSLLGGGEIPDLVVGVVDRGHPGAPSLATGVKGWGHAELLAAPPDRVIVVEGVVADRVDPATGTVL